MINPCKIDARKNDAKNIENDPNMESKWRSKSINLHLTIIQKNTTKNNAKMKRPKAMDPKGR